MSDGGANDVQHIVFYGSLRRNEPAHGRLGLRRALRFAARVRIPGRLFDFGDYPGLRPGSGQVEAELFHILDPAVLDRLDAFELYRSADARTYSAATGAGSLFLRRAIEVGNVLAFAYFYNGRARGLWIPSGRWRRAAHGLDKIPRGE